MSHYSSQSPEAGSDAAARVELAVKLASLTYAIACLLYLVWVMIPAHQRRLMAMEALTRAQNAARRTAFRAGHQAMGLELSGRGTSYGLPYTLSRAAEAAAAARDKLRYAN
jgi:hypothetical protein